MPQKRNFSLLPSAALKTKIEFRKNPLLFVFLLEMVWKILIVQ